MSDIPPPSLRAVDEAIELLRGRELDRTDAVALKREIAIGTVIRHVEATRTAALPPGYTSFLACIRPTKTDLYLNGHPVGEVFGGTLVKPPLQQVTLRDTPFENEAALKRALHAAVDAITIS